jgi:hypothetical protein
MVVLYSGLYVPPWSIKLTSKYKVYIHYISHFEVKSQGWGLNQNLSSLCMCVPKVLTLNRAGLRHASEIGQDNLTPSSTMNAHKPACVPHIRGLYGVLILWLFVAT